MAAPQDRPSAARRNESAAGQCFAAHPSASVLRFGQRGLEMLLSPPHGVSASRIPVGSVEPETRGVAYVDGPEMPRRQAVWPPTRREHRHGALAVGTGELERNGPPSRPVYPTKARFEAAAESHIAQDGSPPGLPEGRGPTRGVGKTGSGVAGAVLSR